MYILLMYWYSFAMLWCDFDPEFIMEYTCKARPYSVDGISKTQEKCMV